MGALLNAACLRARLGQKGEALALLERVFAKGWGKRDWIEHDPDYEILRGEPTIFFDLEPPPEAGEVTRSSTPSP